MLDENGNAGSIFCDRIDLDNIGITGRSQGSAATIRANTMYEESGYFKTAVPQSPVGEQTTNYSYDSANIHFP